MSYKNLLTRLLIFMFVYHLSIHVSAQDHYNNEGSEQVAICFSKRPIVFQLTNGGQSNSNIKTNETERYLDSIIIEIAKIKRPLIYYAKINMIKNGISDSVGEVATVNNKYVPDKFFTDLFKQNNKDAKWLETNGIKFPIQDTFLLVKPKNEPPSSLFSFNEETFSVDSPKYYFTYSNDNDSLLSFYSSEGKLIYSWKLTQIIKPYNVKNAKEYCGIENDLLFSMFNLNYISSNDIPDEGGLKKFISTLGIDSTTWDFYASLVNTQDRNKTGHNDKHLRNIKSKYLPSIILRLYFLKNENAKLYYNPIKHIIELNEEKSDLIEIEYWLVNKNPPKSVDYIAETREWIETHLDYSIASIIGLIILFILIIWWWIKLSKEDIDRLDSGAEPPIDGSKQLIEKIQNHDKYRAVSELLQFLKNSKVEKDLVLKGLYTVLPIVLIELKDGTKNEKLNAFIKNFKKNHGITHDKLRDTKLFINNPNNGKRKSGNNFRQLSQKKNYNLFYIISIEYLADGAFNSAKSTIEYFNGLHKEDPLKENDLIDIQDQNVIPKPDKCLTDILAIIDDLENPNQKTKKLNKITIKNLSPELWNNNIEREPPQEKPKQKNNLFGFLNKLTILKQRNKNEDIEQIISFLTSTSQTKYPNLDKFDKLSDIKEKILSYDKIKNKHDTFINTICTLRDDDSIDIDLDYLLAILKQWTEYLKQNEDREVTFDKLKAFLSNDKTGLEEDLNKLISNNKNDESDIASFHNILIFTLGKLGFETKHKVYNEIDLLGENIKKDLKDSESFKDVLKSNDIDSLLKLLIEFNYKNNIKELKDVWEDRKLIVDYKGLEETIKELTNKKTKYEEVIKGILLKIGNGISDDNKKSSIIKKIGELLESINKIDELKIEIANLNKEIQVNNSKLFKLEKKLEENLAGTTFDTYLNTIIKIPNEIDEPLIIADEQSFDRLPFIEKLLDRDEMQNDAFAAMKFLINEEKLSDKSINLNWKGEFKEVVFNGIRYHSFFKAAISSPFLALFEASKRNTKYIDLPIEYKMTLIKSLFEMALLVKDEAIRSKFYSNFGEVPITIANNNPLFMTNLFVNSQYTPKEVIDLINDKRESDLEKIKELDVIDQTTDKLTVNLMVIAKEIGVKNIDTLVNGYYLPKPLKEYNLD